MTWRTLRRSSSESDPASARRSTARCSKRGVLALTLSSIDSIALAIQADSPKSRRTSLRFAIGCSRSDALVSINEEQPPNADVHAIGCGNRPRCEVVDNRIDDSRDEPRESARTESFDAHSHDARRTRSSAREDCMKVRVERDDDATLELRALE